MTEHKFRSETEMFRSETEMFRSETEMFRSETEMFRSETERFLSVDEKILKSYHFDTLKRSLRTVFNNSEIWNIDDETKIIYELLRQLSQLILRVEHIYKVNLKRMRY